MYVQLDQLMPWRITCTLKSLGINIYSCSIASSPLAIDNTNSKHLTTEFHSSNGPWKQTSEGSMLCPFDSTYRLFWDFWTNNQSKYVIVTDDLAIFTSRTELRGLMATTFSIVKNFNRLLSLTKHDPETWNGSAHENYSFLCSYRLKWPLI